MKNFSPRNKIKVVHVITRFDKGGSAENTYLTLMGLNSEKYDVSLIFGSAIDKDTPPEEAKSIEENVARLRERQIDIIRLPTLVRPISPLKDLWTLVALYGHFRRLNPLIVHTHTSKAGILGRWAAFLAKVPIVCHTPHGHVFWGYFSPLKTRLFIYLEKVTAHITDRLIMLTHQERDDHLKYGIAPPDKFVVIHSGVDLVPFLNIDAQTRRRMRDALSIGEGDFVIGTVGRLTQIKGHRYLLSAFSQFIRQGGQGILVLVGEGELRKELENQANTLGISERVRFLGWRKEVAEIMTAFDVFALPSLNEGMGKAIVEAMASELPVIASDVGGIKDLVIPGENGILVPASDEEKLVAAMMILYKQPKRRKEMGSKGREKAPLYSKEAMVQKIDHLYQRLGSDLEQK